jgi:hypothetical protein
MKTGTILASAAPITFTALLFYPDGGYCDAVQELANLRYARSVQMNDFLGRELVDSAGQRFRREPSFVGSGDGSTFGTMGASIASTLNSKLCRPAPSRTFIAASWKTKPRWISCCIAKGGRRDRTATNSGWKRPNPSPT